MIYKTNTIKKASYLAGFLDLKYRIFRY